MFSANRLADYRGLGIMLNPAAGDSFLITLDASRTMAERECYEPPAAEVLGEIDLLTPSSWAGLARARERQLHAELVEKLALARRRGQKPFDAWNNRQGLGKALAEAHIRRVALESLLASVDAVADTSALSALKPLCALYTVEEIALFADWYLAAGLLAPAQVNRLDVVRTALCEQLVPHVSSLVDAFEIPDDAVSWA